MMMICYLTLGVMSLSLSPSLSPAKSSASRCVSVTRFAMLLSRKEGNACLPVCPTRQQQQQQQGPGSPGVLIIIVRPPSLPLSHSLAHSDPGVPALSVSSSPSHFLRLPCVHLTLSSGDAVSSRCPGSQACKQTPHHLLCPAFFCYCNCSCCCCCSSLLPWSADPSCNQRFGLME